MIRIKKANTSSTEVLSILGRISYAESHGHFIHDKEDLKNYLKDAFSIAKTKKNLADAKNLFYIIYVDDLPVGYAKLVLDAKHESVNATHTCRLDKIYILADYIPMKLGTQFLTFLEEVAKEKQMKKIWLSVYVENHRAIRFYTKNKFVKVGTLNFDVNGTPYENLVLSKQLSL